MAVAVLVAVVAVPVVAAVFAVPVVVAVVVAGVVVAVAEVGVAFLVIVVVTAVVPVFLGLCFQCVGLVVEAGVEDDRGSSYSMMEVIP